MKKAQHSTTQHKARQGNTTQRNATQDQNPKTAQHGTQHATQHHNEEGLLKTQKKNQDQYCVQTKKNPQVNFSLA